LFEPQTRPVQQSPVPVQKLSRVLHTLHTPLRQSVPAQHGVPVGVHPAPCPTHAVTHVPPMHSNPEQHGLLLALH